MVSDRLRQAVTSLEDYRREKDNQPLDLFSTIQTATDNAGDAWIRQALQVVEMLARTKATFTVADVLPHVGPTIDRRAIGGVLLRAERAGIVSKGGWVNSGADRHGRPVREWHSRLNHTPGVKP